MTQPILQHFGQVILHHDPKPASQAPRPGNCTLVAVGTGEPHLLSASALSVIQAATVLLVDDLVSSSVVALARPGARVIHVGRRNSGMTSPQAFVEKIILMAVREGEQVVHLQAGDSLTVERPREETPRLQAAGVNAGSFSQRVGVVPTLWPSTLSQNPHSFRQLNCF
jgi:uroporphyrin-III C-methyltransferase